MVLCLLVTAIGIGFFQLGRPALTWMNEAPQHMTDLRQRVQKLLPRLARFNQAAAAVNNLGATEAEKKEEQKNSTHGGGQRQSGRRHHAELDRHLAGGPG